MTSNPISDEKGDDFKKEILISIGDWVPLKRVNKDDVTKDDKDDVIAEKETRRIQKEEAAAEEQLRLDAEAAEKAN